METFASHLHLPVKLVDHSGPMLARLAGVADPEAKRKAIGAEFIEVFKTYATELEASLGRKPKFLVQARAHLRPPLPDVLFCCRLARALPPLPHRGA